MSNPYPHQIQEEIDRIQHTLDAYYSDATVANLSYEEAEAASLWEERQRRRVELLREELEAWTHYHGGLADWLAGVADAMHSTARVWPHDLPIPPDWYWQQYHAKMSPRRTAALALTVLEPNTQEAS